MTKNKKKMKTEKNNHREYQREWRKENPNKHRSYVNKYREKNKEKRSAWDKAERGVNSIVIKGLCQICNKNKAVERHHPNYDKKEKVILVCKQCHKNLHKNSPQTKPKSQVTDDNRTVSVKSDVTPISGAVRDKTADTFVKII